MKTKVLTLIIILTLCGFFVEDFMSERTSSSIFMQINSTEGDGKDE